MAGRAISMTIIVLVNLGKHYNFLHSLISIQVKRKEIQNSNIISFIASSLTKRSNLYYRKQKSNLVVLQILFCPSTIIRFDRKYKNIDSNLTEYGKGEKLWCYQCNTNLRDRHTTECNDPYPSSYFDLTLCPRNESHHCLKSIIDCAYMK